MTDTPTDKKMSERFGGFDSAEQQERAVFMDAFDAADSKLFAKGVAAGIAALDKLRALRLAESHPSAIREAVEGERRAAMKILEDRIDVCFATVDKHNGVGQIALNASAFGAELAELYAAIRARGEEKDQ
jgi:hypothetical protein